MASNHNQRNPYQLEKRIGRALVQYFKPIRVAEPRLPGQKPQGPQPGEIKPSFKLLKFKRSQTAEITPLDIPDKKRQRAEELEQALPELPKPGNWLELVIYLLAVCKRTSKNLRRNAGNAAYIKALASRGQNKLKAEGNIIDTIENGVD